MKSFTNIFMYVYAGVITIMSFVMVNALTNTRQENKQLKTRLANTQEALEFKIKECENFLYLESERYQMYEMEVSYWGRMYEAMKTKHPATAAALEKENSIPTE
jgi:hypothetical protein